MSVDAAHPPAFASLIENSVDAATAHTTTLKPHVGCFNYREEPASKGRKSRKPLLQGDQMYRSLTCRADGK